eukprot:Blabericola_migrator_1__8395@NODE_436_length_8493_cov_87_644434_g342_i0_p6_GENE_NODE_436_length_8493_cov_87_644434_g342_i0NODE_436_length_8493_cov_87_644434_g342_i0_p6_ORF_typecomplete_len124_score15_33_NODE_436_length_8493_cov_87_644434_g342_i014241795
MSPVRTHIDKHTILQIPGVRAAATRLKPKIRQWSLDLRFDPAASKQVTVAAMIDEGETPGLCRARLAPLDKNSPRVEDVIETPGLLQDEPRMLTQPSTRRSKLAVRTSREYLKFTRRPKKTTR